jgi:hypothetical protein
VFSLYVTVATQLVSEPQEMWARPYSTPGGVEIVHVAPPFVVMTTSPFVSLPLTA